LNGSDITISETSGIAIGNSSTLTINFDGGFTPQSTLASAIKKVALEIRD
jgi:hypothetical protein